VLRVNQGENRTQIVTLHRRLMRGFRLDFIQLDPGRFRAEVIQRQVGRALPTSACFTRRLLQRGVPPPDTLAFALRTSSALATWHGEPFGEDDLLFGTSGGEIDLVSEPTYSVVLASFGIEAAREARDRIVAVAAMFLTPRRGLWSAPHPGEATAFRSQLGELLQSVGRPGLGNDWWGAGPEASATQPQPQPATRSPAADRIEELLGAFLLTSSRCDRTRRAPLTERQRIIKAALPAIIDATEARPDVAALCRIARTSERTFIERFGVPPARFIKLQRLNRVRAALYEARPSAKILDLASQLDFWHMSQFARDYRRLFGELPSQTFGRLSRH